MNEGAGLKIIIIIIIIITTPQKKKKKKTLCYVKKTKGLSNVLKSSYELKI